MDEERRSPLVLASSALIVNDSRRGMHRGPTRGDGLDPRLGHHGSQVRGFGVATRPGAKQC